MTGADEDSALGHARKAFLRSLASERILNRGLFGTAGKKKGKEKPPVVSPLDGGHMLPVFSMADSDNESSAAIAEAMCAELLRTLGYGGRPSTAAAFPGTRPKGARSFEQIIAAYIEAQLAATSALQKHALAVDVLVQRGARTAPARPWVGRLRRTATIADFRAYRHLWDLTERQEHDEVLRAAIGGDYLVRPDIVVWHEPRAPDLLAEPGSLPLVSQRDLEAWTSPMIASGSESTAPLLHASVSCKETLRSDRAQNARTEALNLLRNRKGRAPHIVLVTCEPLPSRLASIAQGTGDVDCVYHVSLPELERGFRKLRERNPGGWEGEQRILSALVAGDRLRDAAALGLDLLT